MKTAADIWIRVAVGDPEECWPFLGSLTTKGYGTFSYGYRRCQAHRVTYELTKGSIPDDLELDHLCRNRRCCNPSHLEPVTGLENVRRSPIHNGARTHCPQGHPYSGDNLRIYRGGRYCRECNRIDARRRKASAHV
jgi:HNH endonuclease